jgi:hypothetical protein
MLLLISVMISQRTPILAIPTMAKATVVSVLMITLDTTMAPALAVVVTTDEGEVMVIKGEDTMIDATTMITAIVPNPTALLPPTRHLPMAIPILNPTPTATIVAN